MQEHLFSERSQLFTELQSCQSNYEGILLRETSFPKADQVNTEVESWIEQAMANWRTLLSPPWKEKDLGEGGRPKFCKSLLEVS